MANTYGIQISILVVDDDPTSLAIVSGFLIKLKHHVVAVKNPLDALDMLRKQSQSFNLILTDVHMPGMSGLQLLQHCEQEFNLPVVLMSADTDKVVMMKGLKDGAAFFLIKPISRDSLDRLWQFAVSWNSKKSTSSSSTQPSSTIDHVPFTPKIITTNNNNATNSFMIENNNNNNNNNANNLVVPLVNNALSSDQNPRGDNNGIFEFKGTIDGVVIEPRPKRPKMVWTTALHNLFLDAVNKLGVDKAMPKKILEYMNVPGLRRENVASHLQKYRIFLKRMSEVTNSMEQGVPNNWNERPFRSSFVLNEITFLTNNLQLQYSQLLSKPQRQGIANGISTFEVGESSNQANDQNKTTNNTLSETQQPSSNQGTQNGKRKRKYTKQTSKTKKQDCKEGTTQNENPSTNSMVVQNLQGATNNYVGLRINSNGELFGTIKDTNTKGCDNGGDHINANASLDGNSKKSVAIEIIENSTYSPWNATPNVLGVNTNVDVYAPNLVDNVNQQESTLFGTPQTMMNTYNLSDDLTQIGIGIHLDENIFESGFSFGSYDVLGNASPSVERVEQGIFGGDDFSLDYSFIQEDELENFLNSYNEDGDTDFTGFI